MAEPESLFDKAPRGALNEGAQRLDRFGRAVKAKQVEECRGTSSFEPVSVSPLSPEERWSQRFMNHAIGPEPQLSGMSSWAPPAPPAPRITIELRPPETALQVPAVSALEPADRLPMGERIGRPAHRSWLARLFRGT
jgi:hypothetical protein